MATQQTSFVDDLGIGVFFAAAVVVVLGILAIWQVVGATMATVGLVTAVSLLAVGGLFVHMLEAWTGH
ncbi:hypothetical protein [Halospeciosus flavus]|uniref:Uncharacterized protein n=1 Tax=Halospeciosus flavus TaxID=3032283 RepID=A0ABD5Z0T6_9EURY|nr:hypothetical protein [Halospeciosus flavus]